MHSIQSRFQGGCSLSSLVCREVLDNLSRTSDWEIGSVGEPEGCTDPTASAVEGSGEHVELLGFEGLGEAVGLHL